MKTLFQHWFIIVILSISVIDIVVVHSQCLHDQRSFLLQFQHDLLFYIHHAVNTSTDCCCWGGVTCNFNGHVIGIDLIGDGFSGVINDSSSLFSLRHLQHLSLAGNVFGGQEMPTKLNNFVNLSYLEFSNTGFIGQIPMGISNLSSLVVLDFTSGVYSNDSLMPELLDLRMFVQNLSRLRELYLDRVRIRSAKRSDWSRSLLSSLPNLRVLSLSECHLSGPIDSLLQNILLIGGNSPMKDSWEAQSIS